MVSTLTRSLRWTTLPAMKTKYRNDANLDRKRCSTPCRLPLINRPLQPLFGVNGSTLDQGSPFEIGSGKKSKTGPIEWPVVAKEIDRLLSTLKGLKDMGTSKFNDTSSQGLVG